MALAVGDDSYEGGADWEMKDADASMNKASWNAPNNPTEEEN